MRFPYKVYNEMIDEEKKLEGMQQPEKSEKKVVKKEESVFDDPGEDPGEDPEDEPGEDPEEPGGDE